MRETRPQDKETEAIREAEAEEAVEGAPQPSRILRNFQERITQGHPPAIGSRAACPHKYEGPPIVGPAGGSLMIRA
jgi:hypothetical protein